MIPLGDERGWAINNRAQRAVDFRCKGVDMHLYPTSGRVSRFRTGGMPDNNNRPGGVG